MGFKQIADLDCEVTTAIGGKGKDGKPNPKSIEGYFIGTRTIPSTKSKTRECSLHVFQTDKGNVGVWGKTNLDNKMKSVGPGQMVRVTFTGMVPTKNNPMYKYNVEVDDSNTIEVSPDSNVPTQDDLADPAFQGGGDDDGGNDADLGAEEETLDEVTPQRVAPPRQAAAAPSAARQRQVQDLLRKRT